MFETIMIHFKVFLTFMLFLLVFMVAHNDDSIMKKWPWLNKYLLFCVFTCAAGAFFTVLSGLWSLK